MANRVRRAALIILFCGFIGAMALLLLCLPKQTFSESEKRTLAAFPEVSVDSILSGRFESGFEDWLSDHAPFRKSLVGLNADYELLSGRNGLSGVILGSGQRLFAAPEELDETAVRNKCAKINGLISAAGLPTTVMLIPESGAMQPEALPKLHAEYADARLKDVVADALDENIAFLWPEERFREAGAGELYYRTDHHLTSKGAWTACAEWLASIGIEPGPAESYDVESVPDFYGSNYSKSGLWFIAPDALELWRGAKTQNVRVTFDDREPSDSLFFTEHLSEMDKYPAFLDGNHGLVTIENPNAPEGNLLIIRDSFGHCFAPFAAEHFRTITLVDLRYYRLPVSELIQERKIDRVLILYGADTFLTDTNFAWLK